MAYTNSPLVSYTKLSPNHSGKRTHSIDRITPHCVVGQASVERIGEIFTPTEKDASCNYGIGEDGRICLIVEEQNRSWCSSSAANDQRAITIECASDSYDPYAFKKVVYESLIDLCEDICRRNGKTVLLWLGDKKKTLAYKPAKYEMVLTVHRWFANKSCPGPWMYERMGDLAEKVTARLQNASEPQEDPSKPAEDKYPDIEVKDAEKAIWDALKGYGFSDVAAAGIMGNLYAESGLDPRNVENSHEAALGMNDTKYTAAVDNGSYDNFVYDGAGYGLAQWTYWSRKRALKEHADWMNVSIGDLAMQIDFLLKEISGYKAVMDGLASAKTIREASDIVLKQYEISGGRNDEAVQQKRAEYGGAIYCRQTQAEEGTAEEYPAVPFLIKTKGDTPYYEKPDKGSSVNGKAEKGIFTIVSLSGDYGKLKSGAGWVYLKDSTIERYIEQKEEQKETFTPYRVRVRIYDLNIRTAPGTNNDIVRICPPGVYTIMEERDGEGATKWGRLKSGVGWISLDYAEKI